MNESEKKAGELRGDPWGELLPGELGEQNPEGTIRDITESQRPKEDTGWLSVGNVPDVTRTEQGLLGPVKEGEWPERAQFHQSYEDGSQAT